MSSVCGDTPGRTDRPPEQPASPTATSAANVTNADLKLKRNTRTSKAKKSLGVVKLLRFGRLFPLELRPVGSNAFLAPFTILFDHPIRFLARTGSTVLNLVAFELRVLDEKSFDALHHLLGNVGDLLVLVGL